MGMYTEFIHANDEAEKFIVKSSELTSKVWKEDYELEFENLREWAEKLDGYKFIGYWTDMFTGKDKGTEGGVIELGKKGKKDYDSRRVHLFCWEFIEGRVIQAERVLEYVDTDDEHIVFKYKQVEDEEEIDEEEETTSDKDEEKETTSDKDEVDRKKIKLDEAQGPSGEGNKEGQQPFDETENSREDSKKEAKATEKNPAGFYYQVVKSYEQNRREMEKAGNSLTAKIGGQVNMWKIQRFETAVAAEKRKVAMFTGMDLKMQGQFLKALFEAH